MGGYTICSVNYEGLTILRNSMASQLKVVFSKSSVIENIRVCLIPVFKNKKRKKLIWGRDVFSVFSKIIFLRIIKRCFHYFFNIQRIYYFLCFLIFFVFS